MSRVNQPGLVAIPRHLLHIELDDLATSARAALLPLLADLPGVPDASHSAQLIGPHDLTLACLAVLARHVGQGLRDFNLSLAHDRARLRTERNKLIFLDAQRLASVVEQGDDRPAKESVLFAINADASIITLLQHRQATGRASFVTAAAPLPQLAKWRRIFL